MIYTRVILKVIKETKPPEFKFDANILIKKVCKRRYKFRMQLIF